MDGKRYAVGMVGGLLLGLAIIGISVAPLPGVFAPAGSVNLSQTGTTKVTSTTTTSSGGIDVAVGNQTNGPPNPGSATTTTATTATSTPIAAPAATGGGSLYSFLSNNQGSKEPSAASLSALSTQPASQDLVVLFPIIGALLLGAMIYRAATVTKEVSEE